MLLLWWQKYSPGHKCKEPKFFQIDAINHSSSWKAPPFEGLEEEDEDKQLDNELPATPEEPVISIHALGMNFFSPNSQNQRFY